MPFTAGEVADILSRRIRDPQQTAHNIFIVFRVLTEAQRLVNSDTRAVQGEAEFTVDVTDQTLDVPTILDVPALFPWAMRIETLRDGIRDLTRVPWRSLAQVDRKWLRKIGATVRVWAPVGPHRVLLYPTPANPVTLTAVYTKRTTALTNTDSVIELPDPLVPALIDLAEQVLLVRQRLFTSVGPVAGRFQPDLDATSR